MPSFDEFVAVIVAFIVLATASGHGDWVWKGVAEIREIALTNAKQDWGCPSLSGPEALRELSAGKISLTLAGVETVAAEARYGRHQITTFPVTKFRKIGGRFYYKIDAVVTRRSLYGLSTTAGAKQVDAPACTRKVMGSIPFGSTRGSKLQLPLRK